MVALAVWILMGSTQPALAQKLFPRAARSALLGGPTLRSAIPAQQLEKKVVRGAAKQWTGWEMIDGIDPLRNSVFCGRAEKGIEAFSGGVFQTVYNGQKEVYGFITTHSLAEKPDDELEEENAKYFLHRFFVLEMMDKHEVWHRIPAEVVQISFQNILDVSLVKFLPEHEALFTPLVLSNQIPRMGEILQSQGLSQYTEGYLPHRQVLEVSPLSLRTEMPWPRFRMGFCGGAVVNLRRELVGVHIGSVAGPTPQEDIGFATHAQFLNVLVDAYHNNGKAAISIVLGGHKVMDLPVDEGIEWVNIYNERGQKIHGYLFDFKFSFSTVERLIKDYNPRYIQFSIGRLEWSKEKPGYVERVPHVRRITYDFQEGRQIPGVPAGN